MLVNIRVRLVFPPLLPKSDSFRDILQLMGTSRRFLGICIVGLIASTASAQFVNGDFETGDFTGWTIGLTSNGTTTTQVVTSYDIDGPGALGTTLNAQFSVGRLVSANGGTEGVNLTQLMNLTGGVQYTFEFDWSSWRNSTTNNAEGGVFSVMVDNVLITSVSSGATSSLTPH
jgi:hypothetical protein